MPLVLINKTLAASTVLGWVLLAGLAAAIAYFLSSRRTEVNPAVNFFGCHGLAFAFLVSLLATASSLFYSGVAGFEPCALCWWQRIFMYPQVLILGLAWLKKDYGITGYGLMLAGLGGLISLYHNYIYYGGASFFPCDAFDLGASCTRRYVFEFGFVTIPTMSLTGFLLVFAFLWLQRLYQQRLTRR